MSRSIGVLSVVLLALGCGSPSGSDGGRTTDGGNTGDAGLPDSGPLGGGGGNGGDGGARDAGGDAGDAGVDAGPPVPGCRSNADCASGSCLLSSGDCRTCQRDFECSGGRLCGTGACAAACVTAASCAAGQDCCGGRCVDPAKDPGHCGQCNHACAPSEFCGSASCHPADFSQLCQHSLVTLVQDQIFEDDTAGRAMSNALVAGCSPAVTSRAVGQTDAGVLRVADGEPLVVGELLVMGGGSFRQTAVRWLENTNQAQVRDTSTSTEAIYSLRDGGVVSSVPLAMLGSNLDRILVQLVRTPSGSLVLNAAGFHGPGTMAAAAYFVQTVLPARSSLTTRWYVVEWEDLDASGGPTAGDRYTLIASGS